MKNLMLLLLGLTFISVIFNSPKVSAQGHKAKEEVPRDFTYPAPFDYEEIKEPIVSRSLSGIVVVPLTESKGYIGNPVPNALVERVTPDWKRRLDATFTNEDGLFKLKSVPPGTYHLKLSNLYFNTLLVKVIVSRKAKNTLKLELSPGT